MESKELFDLTVNVLEPFMGDERERKAIIQSALMGCRVLNQIDWSGSSQTFTVNLVKKLTQFGECSSGKLAVVMLLEKLKSEVGVDKAEQIDALIGAYSQEPNSSYNPASLTQQPHDGKSIRERYDNLPRDEDRARFRALGVLLSGLPFDRNLLAVLWNVDPLQVDGLVYVIELEGLIKTTGGSTYESEPDHIRYASALLEDNERKSYFLKYKNYISAAENIDVVNLQTLYKGQSSYMRRTAFPSDQNIPRDYEIVYVTKIRESNQMPIEDIDFSQFAYVDEGEIDNTQEANNSEKNFVYRIKFVVSTFITRLRKLF